MNSLNLPITLTKIGVFLICIMHIATISACDVEYRLERARSHLRVLIHYKEGTRQEIDNIYAELRTLREKIMTCDCSACKDEKPRLSRPGWFTDEYIPESRSFNAARQLVTWGAPIRYHGNQHQNDSHEVSE